MRKIILLLTLMCAFAWAQDSMKKDSNAKDTGKTKTVTGCLHKEGDNTWLSTRTGKYHLMSKEDLAAHDNHEVKVTGTESKGPVPGGDQTKTVNHLDVSNLEMVSDTCKMGTKKAPKAE